MAIEEKYRTGDIVKKIIIFAWLVFFSHFACGYAKAEFLFCESFTSNWQPINAGSVFSSPTISWIASASKQYATQKLTVSIYKHVGDEEQLIKRGAIDVNPEWDTTGVRNMTLPGEGEYTVALTTVDGVAISKGRVKITGTTRPATEKQEVLGVNLGKLYNQYAPQK